MHVQALESPDCHLSMESLSHKPEELPKKPRFVGLIKVIPFGLEMPVFSSFVDRNLMQTSQEEPRRYCPAKNKE